MDYKQAFGAVFRRLRTQKGLTQEQFQPMASDRYIRNLEKGEYSPSLALVRDLSDGLEISPITFMTLIEAEYTGTDTVRLLNQASGELFELAHP
ncbi:TPA: helix-turn-helix domain-containing protein [Pseudomonas aeruginosa]|nr:helix-turn-helix transcriptional regulator [Pseudomonas aeruginosa]